MHCDLLVGGTDFGYIRAFVEFLLQSNSNQFNITLCDSMDDLVGLLGEQRFGLMVLEESLFSQINHEDLPTDDVILVLTETTTAIDTGRYTPVLKYQKASNIETLILDRLMSDHGKEKVLPASGRAKVIGVYSPSGGAGCSTLSQILAMQKAGRGYKTLLLSLDAYATTDLYFRGMQHQNLSDYLVHVLSGTNWLLGLEKMISVDEGTGVHFFKTVNHEKDLSDLEEGFWEALLSYLKRLSDYDYIIVDLGKQAYETTVALLELCEHRVYMAMGSEEGAHRWQRFTDCTKAISLESLTKNMTLLVRDITGVSGQYHEAYDGILGNDSELTKVSRGNQRILNPHCETFRQIKAVLGHV